MGFSSQIPTKKAVLHILLATAVLSSSLLALFFSRDLLKLFFSSKRFTIETIVQHSLAEESLPTALLVEVMDLSQDRPVNLYTFDTKEAENKLLQTKVFRRVKVEKMSPNRLFVEYEPREAIGIVADLSNTYVDEEGVLFAAHPYFTSKKLPEIYFGDERDVSSWGEKVREEKRVILLNLYRYLRKERISRIDLSRFDAPRLGQREIDLVLKNGSTLRLNPDYYCHQLTCFAYLKRDYLTNKKPPRLVDLRFLDMAYIEN